jgi:hypothetical protein
MLDIYFAECTKKCVLTLHILSYCHYTTLNGNLKKSKKLIIQNIILLCMCIDEGRSTDWEQTRRRIPSNFLSGGQKQF